MRFKINPLKILDVDTESRPLSYLGHDFTTSELTAIACSFGPDHMSCWLLGQDEPEDMLKNFVKMYDLADCITGHYLAKHDLPRINGALTEYGLQPLKPKMVSDTYLHLKPIQGVSRSQENLADMLGLSRPKVGMSQRRWRAANRLEAIGLTQARVVGDVRQHQELRLKLTELGWLNPPKMWSAE